MLNRFSLQKDISTYSSEYKEEVVFAQAFLQLLQQPRCFHRDHLPGHITGSAWIIDESKKFVLLTHHAKLNRWLQPGGHADGDENIVSVCTREACEETGLTSIQPVDLKIFDLDIHTIPARKDFPEHQHFDIRLLFTASMEESLIITEESHDLQWVSLNEIGERTGHNASMLRMAEKVQRLF